MGENGTSRGEGRATLRLESDASRAESRERFLTDVPAEGNVVLVTTARSAQECIEDWRQTASDLPHRLGVVSVGELSRSAAGTSSLPPTSPAVVAVDDPSDLTTLGVTLNRLLYSWVDPNRPTHLRVESLTGLLQYVDPATLRPFLQVLAGRVRETGTTAEFVLDPTAHDAETVEQFRALFDDVVDLATPSADGSGVVEPSAARATRDDTGRFRAAVAAAGDPILVVDAEGTVVDANPAAGRLVEGDDPVGRTFDGLFGESASDVLETVWWGEEWRGELAPDGADDPLVATAAPLSRAEGATDREGAVVVLTDVSELRRRVARLRRQNERLEEFASSVAHDIRNQLQLAQGNLSLLREKTEDVATPLERMEDVLEDALATAREAEPEAALHDLGSIAREAWHGIDAAGADLVVDHSPSVRADREKLLRLFRNLFRNAVEHGSTGDESESGSDDAGVTVHVGTLEGGFYVADDGPGIPPDQWDQIFDQGFSTREGNTGYGLTIVERICEVHDWSIVVGRSSAGGARFEITGVEFGDTG